MPALLIPVFDLIPEFSSSTFGHIRQTQPVDHRTDCASLVLIGHEFAVKVPVFKPGGLRLF